MGWKEKIQWKRNIFKSLVVALMFTLLDLAAQKPDFYVSVFVFIIMAIFVMIGASVVDLFYKEQDL